MRNILLSEYRSLLSRQAALWGAEHGADLSKGDPKWRAPLGNLSVSISLESRGVTHMMPEAQIGMSGSLPRDAHRAMVVLMDAQTTLQKALSCLASLESVRVYLDECPCDYCNGRGKDRGATCKHCDGAGVRTSPEYRLRDE